VKIKNLLIAFLVTGSLFATVSESVPESVPVEKRVPVDKLFIPAGFDNNDNVEVVISGYLPNLCHKNPRVSVTRLANNKIELEVTSLYYDKTNPFCAEMVVPFTKTVPLGVLDQGKYTIFVNEKKTKNFNTKIKETLVVEDSVTNTIDRFEYAYVTNVLTKPASDRIHLKGYTISDCYELDEIEVIDNGEDAYSILPKMTQVRDFCPRKMIPFTYEYVLPDTLDKARILLHVRKMDGDSINTIIMNE